MIRTDLIPHPYFNVKSPDFYKKQKAMFELSRAKYKLVNQIRSGQEQELLQKQIEEIKRKQEALNRFTKLKETLTFQLDDQNPRVYNEAGGGATKEEDEGVEEAEEEEEAEAVGLPDIQDMTGVEMKKEIKKINNMIGRKDKASFIDTTPARNLEVILDSLRNAKNNEIKKNILDVAKTEQTGKKASPSPKRGEEAEIKQRPRPAFLGDLGAAKRKLKKREERPLAEEAAGRPLSMLEELKAKQKTGLSKSKRAPVEKRKTSQEKLEEEISKVILRRTKATGKGISKKQKQVLFMGSAMAGNNNKILLNKIMDI